MQEKKILHENFKESPSKTLKHLQRVINDIPQLISWKDVNSKYLGCNKSFWQEFGLKSENDVIGKDDYDIEWSHESAKKYIETDKYVMDNNLSEYTLIDKSPGKDGKPEYWELKKSAMHDSNGFVNGVLSTCQNITASILLQLEMDYRINLEGLIISLTHRFVHIDDQEIENLIFDSLAKLTNFIDVDRSYFSVFNTFTKEETKISEYCAPGIENVRNKHAAITYFNYPWWQYMADTMQDIVLNNMNDLPECAIEEKKFYQLYSIKSNLEVLICSDNDFFGFLGFETVNKEVKWKESDKDLLRTVGEIFAGAIQRKNAQLEIKKKNEFEELLITISSDFIDIPVGKIDETIIQSLEKICKLTNIDRSYIDRIDNKNLHETMQYEWYADYKFVEKNIYTVLPLNSFPWWSKLIKNNQPIIINNIDELPDEAAAEKKYYLENNIKSNLEIKLYSEGNLIGFLGFTCIKQTRNWSQSEIKLFSLVAEIISGAIYRKGIEEKIREKSELENALVDISTDFIRNNMDTIDTTIIASLRKISQKIGANRSYIYSIDQQKNLCLLYEWCGENIGHKVNSVSFSTINSFKWWTENIQNSDSMYFNSLDDIPEYAVAEKNHYANLNIESNIEINMYFQGTLYGFLGFESVGIEQDWNIHSLNGLKMLAEIFVGALKRREYEKTLEKKNKMEEMLLDLSTEFIRSNIISTDEIINTSLQKIGRTLNVERCYVDLMDSSKMTEIHKYEWKHNSLSSYSLISKNIDLDYFPWWKNQIAEKQAAIIPSVDDMPDEAKAEREYLLSVGIKSYMELNMYYHGRIIGFFGMETVHYYRDWDENDVRTLHLAGEIITNAIVRKDIEQSLAKKIKGEELIITMSNKLMQTETKDIITTAYQILSAFGKLMKADFGYISLFEGSSRIQKTICTWKTNTRKIKKEPEIGVLDLKKFKWWSTQYKKRTPIHFNSLSELPKEAADEYQYYKNNLIYSEMEMNMSYGNKFVGFIGFDTIGREINWQSDDLRLLRMLAEILANTLIRYEMETELIESRLRLLEAQNISHIGNWEYNLETGTAILSDEIYRILGYPPSSFDANLRMLIRLTFPDDLLRLKKDIKKMLTTDARIESDFRAINSYGEIIYISLTGKRSLNEHNQISMLMGTIQNISERKKVEIQLEYMSFHDALTGLFNRTYFDKKIHDFDAEQYLPLSIINGDVNGLKLINDTLGHEQGDNMLKMISKIMLENTRKSDLIFRWGGDEFIILLPYTDQQNAEKISSKIKIACSEFTDIPFPLSISLGISCRQNMIESMYDILKTVEDRMYQNKLLEQNSVRSSIIASLQESLAEKTLETEEHSQRLRAYSSEIGDLLGLSSSEIDELKVLSSIHDIGKIAIPEVILMKPGRLTEEEWEIIKKHPEIGYRIAQSTPELSNIAEAILCHHERWDGTGYPRGLKEEQIPLVARILTLVDSFDVMINGRPYQTSCTVEEALEEINRCSGSQFDPRLAKIFISIIRKKNIK